MARILCLAQAHAALRPPRARKKAAAPSPKPVTFTILERAPVRLPAHTPVWTALRRHATRQPIIDAEFPGDAFEAHVVGIDQLGPEAVAAIAEMLADRRAAARAAEKDASAADILGKRFDKLFAQEAEWLWIRNLLAAALARASTAGGRARDWRRALLLIDV